LLALHLAVSTRGPLPLIATLVAFDATPDDVVVVLCHHELRFATACVVSIKVTVALKSKLDPEGMEAVSAGHLVPVTIDKIEVPAIPPQRRFQVSVGALEVV
jgi:hypothetical protein